MHTAVSAELSVEMLVPQTMGNADPEWPIPRPGPGTLPGAQGPVVLQVQPVDAYPNPLPRKCVWAMLLLSCLLVLRVQQDRYSEVVHWRGGVPDMGSPFPWELNAFVTGDDPFEATFFSPILRKASTFMRSPSEASMLITGLSTPLLAGGDRSASEKDKEIESDLSAVTSSAVLPASFCPGNTSGSCFLGAKRVRATSRAHHELAGSSGMPQGVSCHRFLAGASLQAMRPLVTNVSRLLCMRSNRIQAVVPVGVNGTTIVVWNPVQMWARSQQDRARVSSCMVVVKMPDMQVGATLQSEPASTALFDHGSGRLVTVGFSSVQTIVVHVYEPDSLEHLEVTYRLPISVAWLLRAPRISNGFLLFLGSEEPFLGTIFTIDLRKSKVYQQDPPPLGGGNRRPRRRRLPDAVIQRPPNNGRVRSGVAGVPPDRFCDATVVSDPGPS